MSKLKNKILKNYLLNKCSTREIESLRQWLEESEDHASQLFKIEELYHLGRFHMNQDAEHIEKAEQNLFKAIDNSKSIKFKSPHFLRYAAVAIIILCTCSYVGYFAYHTNKAFSMIEVSATAKSIKRVLLPDGTNVWLNHSSTLRYPQKFTKEKRDVELKGEAYFEVTKNPHQPFIVKSDAMTIEVLGTKFNFNTKHSNNYEELSLLEGVVQIHGNNDKNTITIIPGQKIILNKQTQQITIQRVDARMESLWHENMISFKRSNIQKIVAILERLYNIHINIDSNINQRMTYSGEMRRYEQIDSALKALCYSMPICYKRKGEYIYLYQINK